MKKEESAKQFLEEQFKNQRFPTKAAKEFIVLGFLSAHTGLLTNEEQLEQEKTILKQLSSLNYLQNLIVRNQQKINDDFVQSLSDYIQLLCRKRVYNNQTDPIQGVAASINLGIQLYQMKYQVIMGMG